MKINMKNARQVLKNVFGYDSFRPLQEEIINNILNKKDTLAVMPTGGGKSICYQLPALMMEGLTVVVSPLISLMNDQVDQLHALGVNAVMLNSSLPFKTFLQNCELIRSGKAKLLYIAPESLFRDDITDMLESIKIECITIDEAHCISEWGHDFRPEYRKLGEYRKKFPKTACLALTATATPRVQEDIIKILSLSGSGKYIASFDRKNLFLQVMMKSDPMRQTETFLRSHKDESGIIYCATRKQVDELYEQLKAKGYSILPYHAGLSDKERELNQRKFSQDDIQIIAATVAFGMGINKSNVRFVLHYDLPKNPESYYQEIGRAGRDGLQSDCLLLFSYGDISKIKYFIDQKESETERQTARRLLSEMVKFAETGICRRLALLGHFGEHPAENNCGMCDNCTGDDASLDDITIAAQKFLSAAKRTGERFGAQHLTDILTGTETEKVLRFGHNTLSVFGVGSEYSPKEWLHLINQFQQYGLIARDPEFGSIKLTEKSNGILFNGTKLRGTLAAPEYKKKEKVLFTGAYDRTLFDLLKKKRKEIADEEYMPPFVIFSDRTLREMASVCPVNTKQFLSLNGVGAVKLEKYGKAFMEVIKGYK
jgi:ATP-dependent DNA helicase RecQ